jgi:hypothetical protein
MKQTALFWAASALLALAVAAHNRDLLSRPIVEHADHAANSLLVMKAKRLELLHGHYSRLGFYHPGPALIWVEAASEVVLHDWLHLTPDPFNAHVIGHALLKILLVALAAALVARSGGLLGGVLSGLVVFAYCSLQASLIDNWYPPAFLLIILAFFVCCASVASGRIGHLGWLALTGGLALHAHVSFVAFLAAGLLYVAVVLWRTGALGRLREDRRSWATAAAVAGLMLLPIVLHTVVNYPGEIDRYVSVAKGISLTPRTAWQVGDYVVRAMTDGVPHGRLALALLVLAAPVCLLRWSPGPARSLALHLGGIALLELAVVVYYTARKIDDLSYLDVGAFFVAVPLLLTMLIALRLADLARRRLPATLLLSAAALAAGFWCAAQGQHANPYPGRPELGPLADAIAADPRWQAGPLLISYDVECWGDVAGLLVQLQRRGRRPVLCDHMLLTFVLGQQRLDGRHLPSPLWQIDLAPHGESCPGVRRTLAMVGGTMVREMETASDPGLSGRVAADGRALSAKPLQGWYLTNGALHAVEREAQLHFDCHGLPPGDACLTLEGASIPDSRAAHRVQVHVNGHPVGEVRLEADSREFRLRIPQSTLVPGAARVTLTMHDAKTHRTLFPARNTYSITLHAVALRPWVGEPSAPAASTAP